MNRGFAFYFKNALKSSAATIWKNKNILSVWVYFLAELVARVTIIFSAIFDLANVRQGKIVDENAKMDIPETLKVATKGKPVWTMVLSIIAEAFIFLGGALIIAAITAVLALLGFAFTWLVNGPIYMVYLFCIPGGFLLLVYTVLMCLIFSPTPYIIETNPEVGVYETVKICFDTMKGRGKFTAFMNFFVPTLLELLVVYICLGGGWIILTLVQSYYMYVILAAWGIISIALMLFTLPMLDLAKKVAQKNLFADIVSDPVNANKRTAGINIKNCNGVKFEKSEIKDNLVALFDETQSDSVPEPDSPARKKIKELAEKEAKKLEKPVEVTKEAPPAEDSGEKQTPPEKPVEPDKPVGFAHPVEPDKPVGFAHPVEPDKPVEPAQPVEPVKPVEPAQPVEPVKPVEPLEPAQSEEPASDIGQSDELPSEKPAVVIKPKSTRTVKPKTEQSEDAPSEEQPAAEKPKKAAAPRKKRVKISG